jgi:probable F420-dependent oxidoreductase
MSLMKYAIPMPHAMRLKAVMQPWEPSVTGRDQQRIATRADQLGYDKIQIPEHLVVPVEHVELSGAHYLHATAAQGFYAGATERIRLSTGITLLALQHPIIMAKALSTIDWLSGGRIEVAFGVGWLKGEFDALGVPFHERGRISDEYLAAIIELWTADVANFEGKYVSFHDIVLEPKPVQKPYLPIWIGGDADAALRRAARFASGWTPFLTKPEDYAARLDFIKSQPEYKGGPFDLLHISLAERIGEGHVERHSDASLPTQEAQKLVDRIGWLRDQGVTYFTFAIPDVRDTDEFLDYAQWFIEEVKPRVG